MDQHYQGFISTFRQPPELFDKLSTFWKCTLALGKVHNVSIKSGRVFSSRIFSSFRNHIVAFDESTSMYGVSTLQYVAPLRRYAASNLWNGFQYVWDASIVLKPKHTSFMASLQSMATTIIWSMLQPLWLVLVHLSTCLHPLQVRKTLVTHYCVWEGWLLASG